MNADERIARDERDLYAAGVEVQELFDLAAAREAAQAVADRAHQAVLDAVLAEVERNPDVNVRALARVAGVAHATVYNELARRRALAPVGDSSAPAPAPADTDPDAANENTDTEDPHA